MEFTTKLKILVTTLVLGMLGFLIIPNLQPLEEMPLGASVSAPSEGELVGYWTLNEDDLTEGEDVMSGWDFTSGWSNINAVADDADSFTSSANGGIYKSSVLTVGKTYKINIVGTVSVGSFAVYDGAATTDLIISDFGSAEFTAQTTILYLRNTQAATTDITNLEIVEIDAAIKDKSGNGNNGAIASTTVNFVADQNGVPNQAMTFDGVGDLVNCGSDSSIDNIFDGGGTISAWINPSSDGESNIGMIFHKKTGWYLNVVLEDPGVAVKLRFEEEFDGTIGFWDTDSTIIPIGSWTHIAVNYDADATANNPTFYINGVPYTVASGLTEQSTPVGTRLSDAETTLALGSKVDGDYAFDGSISDAMIFSETLTEDEVSQLYKAGRTTTKIKVDATSLITGDNRYFDSDTGFWTKETGWTITAGVARATTASTGYSIYKSGLLTVGNRYKITFTIKNYSAGGVRFNAGANYGTTRNANGTYTEDVTMGTGAVYLAFGANGTATLDIDDISVVDITNAITPKLQKGLILDMPLAEPYTEAVTRYTSDFSGGVDSWTASAGAVSAPETVDSITESLKYTSDSTSDVHFARNPFGAVEGHIYNIKFDYYIPTQSNVDGFEFRGYDNGNEVLYTAYSTGANAPTLDSWTTLSITVRIDDNNGFRIYSTDGSSISFTDAGGDDYIAIKNMVIKELDGTTKDNTPNGNDGTVSGATLKYDGLVNGGEGIVYINQDEAYGTWEFDVNKSADGNTLTFQIVSSIIGNVSVSGQNGYYINFDSAEDIRLSRRDDGGWAGNVFAGGSGYAEIDTDYRIKITRDLSGVFTGYIKGGSFGWDDWTTIGTGTDNTHTTSNYLVADLDNGDTVSNLKINGKRHSLADATVSSGTWTTTGPAYDFDGSNDYIDLGSDKPTDLTGDITISAWINPSGWGEDTAGRIIDNGKFIMWTHTTNDLIRFASDGSTIIYSDNNSIVLDTWQHVLVTRPSAGTNTNIYINGVLSGDANQDSGTPVAGTTNTFIGNNDAGDRTFDGQILGLKIFNCLLSTSEIDYLYSKEVNKY